jgi:SAM-dependent methyltransferase
MKGDGYYDEKLSAAKLRRCYEIAPPRIRRYLGAELDHVLGHVRPGDTVLDLGCGYGRTLAPLADKAGWVLGIDTSLGSLRVAREGAEPGEGQPAHWALACMDAAGLALRDGVFDVAVCIQNGISAFHVSRSRLMAESLRVIRPGGIALFSTYSAKFWEDRLEWFELQAAEGLLGEIDRERTGDGTIVCKDGFHAGTVTPPEFASLASRFDVEFRLVEVDRSSLFCELIRPAA